MRLLESIGDQVLGDVMRIPAEQYRELLKRKRLTYDVDSRPRVFLSASDAWTNCTLRYLVPARERRKWATELFLAVSEETAKPEHKGKIITSYPRQEVVVQSHPFGTNP